MRLLLICCLCLLGAVACGALPGAEAPTSQPTATRAAPAAVPQSNTAAPPTLPPPQSLPTAPPTAAILATATAVPSPTPIVYTVSEGDTLSAIAARYGVTIPDVVAVNPGLDANVLQVGQTVTLPASAVAPTAAVPAGAIAESVAVVVSQARLLPTPLGTTWVLGAVMNQGQQPVENVQVAVTIGNGAGETVREATTWAATTLLRPQESAPFALLLPDPLPADATLSTAVAETYPLTNLARYVELTAANVVLTAENGRVRLGGELQNVGSATAAEMVLVATFYNDQGAITGYQEQRLSQPLPPGSAQPFTLETVPPDAGTATYSLTAVGVTETAE